MCRWFPGACVCVFVWGTLGFSSIARADRNWLVSADANGVLALGEPQASQFGVGGTVGVGLHRPLASFLLAGLRLRSGLLTDGDPPSQDGFEDTSVGSFSSLMLGLRGRVPFDGKLSATGPFVDVAAGGTLTGGLVRFGFEAAVGYLFRLGPVNLGPTFRYQQVLQPDEGLEDRDARLFMLGVEVLFFDNEPEAKEQKRDKRKPKKVPPADRDKDGVPDKTDKCPDVPEDKDGFEDGDGCPDEDNDQDGLLDGDDQCPDEAEDKDGFEDSDGCPDPDNDQDGVLDENDQCPTKKETINGVKDDDGCPDRGVIEMVDDRIVLDGRVLFATESWQIRRRGWRLLRAVRNLQQQHPEWEVVVIEGHADYRGGDRYNLRLSEQRAERVMNALIELGVPAELMTSKGFGSAKPVNRGSSERSLARNRRVEFVVIQKRPATPEELGSEGDGSAVEDPDGTEGTRRTDPANGEDDGAEPGSDAGSSSEGSSDEGSSDEGSSDDVEVDHSQEGEAPPLLDGSPEEGGEPSSDTDGGGDGEEPPQVVPSPPQ